MLVSDVARSWYSTIPPVLWMAALVGSVWLIPVASRAEAMDRVEMGFYLAWTLFCVTYIGLTVFAFAGRTRADFAAMLRQSRPPTQRLKRFVWALNGGGAVGWAVTGSAIALGSIVALGSNPAQRPGYVVASAVLVLAATIGTMMIAFSVLYARDWATSGGIEFPGTPEPRLGDFVYLSMQTTTAFGSNDVVLTNSRTRRTVTVHAAIAFIVNTVVVALLVATLLRAVGAA